MRGCGGSVACAPGPTGRAGSLSQRPRECVVMTQVRIRHHLGVDHFPHSFDPQGSKPPCEQAEPHPVALSLHRRPLEGQRNTAAQPVLRVLSSQQARRRAPSHCPPGLLFHSTPFPAPQPPQAHSPPCFWSVMMAAGEVAGRGTELSGTVAGLRPTEAGWTRLPLTSSRSCDGATSL